MQPTPEQVHNAALLAWRNALRFFKDAKALIDDQSYGHAFGLLVFAEEEAGKALIFRLYADDYLRHPQWIAVATGKHQAKHASMGVTVMLRLLYFFMFGLSPDESPRAQRKRLLSKGLTPGTIPVLRHHLQEAVEDIPRAINTVADLIEELSNLGQLQLRREHSFFVDLHKASGEPTGPRDFNKDASIRQLQMTRVRLAVVQGFVGSGRFSLQQRREEMRIDPATREKIASFEAFLFGKKGLRVILEWFASHQPNEWVQSIRQFAANQEHAERVKALLTELLSKWPFDRVENQGRR